MYFTAFKIVVVQKLNPINKENIGGFILLRIFYAMEG